jgi:hypothetical protein
VVALAFPAFAQESTETPTPALAQAEQTISIGDSVTGELTEDQPSALYTLEAEAGQALNITLTSDDFDTYLTLLDADGEPINENDDSSGTNSGFAGFVLPPSSSYALLVESYDQHTDGGIETGAFTLTVGEQNIERIEYTQVIEDELTLDEPSKDYVFTGQAGDVIVATESSDDFDSYLHLLDSSGTELTYNDDGGGNLNSLIGPYTLPTTGTYTLRAGSLSSDSEGSFTLTLNKTEMTAAEYDEPIEATFTPSDQAKYFTFEGTQGDLVTISVNSNGAINTSLTLNDTSNYQITSDDDSGPGLDPEIYHQLLSSTGTYTVVVRPVTAGSGAITLTISRTPPPSLDDGPQTIAFTESQTSGAITFTGEAGETVRVNLHLAGGESGSPSVSIMQNGTTVASASGSTVSDLNFSFTPTSDGQVIVQITDYSYNNLSYEVSLVHENE